MKYLSKLRLNIILILLAVFILAVNKIEAQNAICGTEAHTPSQLEAINNQLNNFYQLGKIAVAVDITIPVAFHIVHKANGDGLLSKQTVEDEIVKLNNAYEESHFQFKLFSIDSTENDQWTSSWDYRSTMKNTLAINPKKILNFYSVFNIYTDTDGSFVTGYSYTPDQISESSYHHGVVMLSTYFYGQSNGTKKTDIHEVGHYLGLDHTFNNGCAEPGDDVDDTPYQDDGDDKWTCNENLDTCPTKDGKDPVHNYMGYTNCRTEFTPGQFDRMNEMIALYKPSLISSDVMVDQRRKNNALIDDFIGEWNGVQFENHGVPFSFPYIEDETKVLGGSQVLLSSPNEKYKKWTVNYEDDEVDVTNHHTFTIDPSMQTLTSQFEYTYSGVSVINSNENTSSSEGLIQFKDPWLIDYPDSLYGYNLRNRGMDDAGPDKLEFKSRPS
ncbi:MAG: hypothetical protein KJ799_18100, partial [Bacteroidetes bacterium]|nr:hypothetical protein [Bacteroidota bacterium]